ncbi:hypothetical protein MKX01_040061 [Papaver californicum]|nr:hypothetical protein MKX01_040061 [Papaver californicum]
MLNCRYLVTNGVISQTSDVPPVASFLEAHPGAYTTSRTHGTASRVLFWERHLRRLVESARILAETKPGYLFGSEKAGISSYSASPSSWDSIVWPMVNHSLRNVLPVALEGRNVGEELAITALVKRLRKCLENMRPSSTNELMLSNDGDHILEGCLNNFFVVRCKENSDVLRKHPLDLDNEYSFEVQTASIKDDSLRLVQHVGTICVPSPWEDFQHKTWKDVAWSEKRFKEGPGRITAWIQREVLKRSSLEGYPVLRLGKPNLTNISIFA